jgi:hypothetical protein
MQRYYDTVTDQRGNALAGASVAVQSGGTNVAIYSDDGVTRKSNPMTTDASGGFSFYAANGTYDLVVTSASGVVSSLPSRVRLFDVADAGLATSAALAASSGAALVGHTYTEAPAYLKTVSDIMNGDAVSLDRFLSKPQIAEVQSGSAASDLATVINSAIAAFPLHTTDPTALSPLGFANGGGLHFRRGRYRLESTLLMQRGMNLVGNGSEATQFISFHDGDVIQYLDAGGGFPDKIGIKGLSVYQDASVVATSGAAFHVADGTYINPAVALMVDDFLAYKTWNGILVRNGIGCAVSNSNIINSVSHSVVMDSPLTGGLALNATTSTTFYNVYSQQSGGSGFYLQYAAYCSFVGCAADSNTRYGYELDNCSAVTISGGAEQNVLGGVYLSACRGTNVYASIVDRPAPNNNTNAVTLNACTATVIGGRHLGTNTSTGYSIKEETPGNYGLSGVTLVGLERTGTWNTTNAVSNAKHITELGTLFGFTGGRTRNWAFGLDDSDSTAQLSVSSNASRPSESTVTNGLVASPCFDPASGAANFNGLYAFPQTAPTAVTYATVNGAYIQAVGKGAGSTITRATGIVVRDQTAGSTANTNVALGTDAPAAGTWNIYSASTRDNVWLGKHRYVSSTGPFEAWGTGDPEGVLAAPVGSRWGRTDGGAGTCLYVKESGTGNTGWVAK